MYQEDVENGVFLCDIFPTSNTESNEMGIYLELYPVYTPSVQILYSAPLVKVPSPFDTLHNAD